MPTTSAPYLQATLLTWSSVPASLHTYSDAFSWDPFVLIVIWLPMPPFPTISISIRYAYIHLNLKYEQSQFLLVESMLTWGCS